MSYLLTEYATALMHSAYWNDLVSQGWVTMYVELGVAKMIRQRKRQGGEIVSGR